MSEVGCGMWDVGFRISDFGFRISEVGCGISDVGFRISDFGGGMLDFGCGISDFGFRRWDASFQFPVSSSILTQVAVFLF